MMSTLTGTVGELLELLRQPCEVATLCERSRLSRPVLQGLLGQLKARGLVTTALPGVGACNSGCGMCSMQNFCPSSQDTGQEPQSLLRKPLVWRLTTLGEEQLK